MRRFLTNTHTKNLEHCNFVLLKPSIPATDEAIALERLGRGFKSHQVPQIFPTDLATDQQNNDEHNSIQPITHL